MASHSISISVINNQIGIPPSSDGIMGLFMQAVAVSNNFQLGQLYLLTQLSDATALGLTAAYDTTNGTAVYQQISEFYAQAGTGAYLWIYGISKATSFSTFFASAAFENAVQLTNTNPFNRVKMIGSAYAVPTALQDSTDFPSDVLSSVTALQTAQQALFALGYQISGIVDGAGMSSAVTPTTIGSQAANTAFSVSVCITSTLGNGVSQVGMALGRFARISLGHGFGDVSDGPVWCTTAFLTNSIWQTTASTLTVGDVLTVFGPTGATVTYNSNTYALGASFTVVSGHTSFTAAGGGYCIDNCTPVNTLIFGNNTIAGITPTGITALGNDQYLFVRQWLNQPGFYWNDGATCENPSLQLSTQEFNRVANAMAADALAFFIPFIGSNLPLDPSTGNVAQSWLNGQQTHFFTTYINPLINSGDISDGSLVVTGPNFNSLRTLNFVLTIVPTPLVSNITGVIQFSSTL